MTIEPEMGDKEITSQLEWSLYENGMDSIRHGIEHYFNDTNEHRRYKYAILHISQGVTLLLKERLRKEHPNFIFTIVANESKTVDIEETLIRLKNVAKVEFTDEQEKVIKELANLRNKIEHFALTISKQQADNIISRLLPFLVSFTRDELDKWFGTEIGEESWQALLSSQEYRVNAIRSAEKQLNNERRRTFLCPDCNAYTASTEKLERKGDVWKLNYDSIRCLVCNQQLFYITNCRECGDEKIFYLGTMPWNASYCHKCYLKFEEEFPKFGSTALLLLAELRRWFSVHDQITGQQIFDLLSNIRGPGSGFFSSADEILRNGVIDFVYERDRIIHKTRTEVSGGWQQVHKDDTYKWSYHTDLSNK